MILPLLERLNNTRIILASGSPRRKQILESVDLKIEVIASTFEENLEPSMFPSLEDFVIETCFQKAREVSDRLKGRGESAELIIAADTIVALDGKVYGKPMTDENARDMLKKLSGKPHEALTGVTLIWNGYSGDEKSSCYMDKFCEKTKVQLADLNDDLINAYINTKEPWDKAGAYGIQGLGGSLVEKIEGDFYNVMGLPLHRLCKTITNHYTLVK